MATPNWLNRDMSHKIVFQINFRESNTVWWLLLAYYKVISVQIERGHFVLPTSQAKQGLKPSAVRLLPDLYRYIGDQEKSLPIQLHAGQGSDQLQITKESHLRTLQEPLNLLAGHKFQEVFYPSSFELIGC